MKRRKQLQNAKIMVTFTFMSLVTSIKDYVEVVHKFVETDPNMKISTYYDFGSILTFIILSGKEVLTNVLTFQWFQKLWSIPNLIPDIASAMISEISVFDGYLKNTQTFFENPLSYGNNNFFIYCSEKFIIGFLNSIFLCLPTSLAHIITLRRFVMQGLEAGFISGLGTIAGNIVWIGSILFGFRFFVIPWLSLDLFRYFLGFILIVKYMWDSYTERRMVLEDLSKYKIFLLTFLLSFTEQTTIYPFLSNLAIGSDSTILESFPTNNFYEFGIVHCCYLLGILLGSLSLLQFTCWFWENPAFQIYMWFISSFKTTTNVYSKLVNLGFLYLTMICAISNISYFGLDYTLTKPLGFVHEDRLLDQKALLETAFLNTKASDRNTRRNRGRHGRRERWKRRVRRYRTFDASLYDQGIYDLLTIEDLNYGFDRFWLRRKIRNHRVRFRFFPGPWMRSFKKQLSRPRLESFMGPRVEFFRILFEQAYHHEFHEFSKKKNLLKSPAPGFDLVKKNSNLNATQTPQDSRFANIENMNSIYWNIGGNIQQRISKQKSTLRKFVRKMNTRIKVAKIKNQINNPQNFESAFENSQNGTAPLFSKSWKSFSKIENSKLQESIYQKSPENSLFQRFYNTIFLKNDKNSLSTLTESKNGANVKEKNKISFGSEVPINRKNAVQKNFSKKERFLERYKTFLTEKTEIIEKQNFSKTVGTNAERAAVFPSTTSTLQFFEQAFEDQKTNTEEYSNIKSQKMNKDEKNFRTLQNNSQYRSMTLLHPLKFYFQKEQALKKKFQFYGVKLFRNFGVENNAPYFRVMMKRFFYHYKPSLRWERTLRVATMRRARRKNSRLPRKLNISKTSQMYASGAINENNSFENGFSNVNPSSIAKPTHFYSLVDKRASRYRSQIYKDVLQHWYYNPLNRFLLKVDVDSFIRRQPNSYFLTKNDEKLLHLKRQLLSEYYETLRWYTYMQHYSTMKHQIGGTKSLSSRAYNQQFVGTFKKIRHLFNITPNFQDNTVLKFDQPLYNEYNNTKTSQIFNTSIIHEELLADDLLFSEKPQNPQNQALTDSRLQTLPEDFSNQSAKILREYLTVASPIRQQYIQNLLVEKNYWELTKFLFKGQKMRGTNPITNETEFFNQEKQYLLENNTQNSSFETNQFKQEIWITLFQKCRNKLYDQEALKNYVSLKKEKYEIQKQRHQKYLKNRFQRMKESLQTNVFPFENQNSSNAVFEFEKFSGYPSSVQKAMKESILWEKNSRASSSFQTVEKFFVKKNMLQKTNIRQNRPNLYSTMQSPDLSVGASGSSEPSKENFQKNRTTLFQESLKNSMKKRIVEIYEAEKNFQKKFETRKKKKETQKIDLSKRATPEKQSSPLLRPFNRIKQFVWNLMRFKYPFQQNDQRNLQKMPTLFQNFVSKMSFFVENPQKNIEFWKKRENALSKRRKIRKTLKRLRNQNTATAKIVFENTDFSIPFDKKMQNSPNRQKNDQLEETRKTHENTFFKKQQASRGQSWKKYSSFGNFDSKGQNNEFFVQNESVDSKKNNTSLFKNVFSFQKDFFSKKFQRKRSRLRRYSSFKGRGPIKKRTLREKLKRQFKSLKKYGASRENIASDQLKLEREKKKVELIQFITQRNYEANGEFLKKDQKQRRTRQMKHRVWKKKKQNFAQKRRKLRKRRRSTIAKIRVFNKKLQRILAKKQIQTWWWQTFFPKFQKTAEKTWQVEKNKQIQKQLFDLSEKEILERDQMVSKNSNSFTNAQNAFSASTFPSVQALQNIKAVEKNSSLVLQIGDKDYKPLALPEAFRIREKLLQKEILRFEDPSMNKKEQTLQTPSTSDQQNTPSFENLSQNISATNPNKESANSFHLLEQLTQNLTTNENNRFSNNTNSSKFLVGTNPIPFYAGWDDSLRKFVITNRLLSRKECFSCSPLIQKIFFEKSPVLPSGKSFSNDFPTLASYFSKVPLQGMNAATTLYWQIPFTTYDPDQFFALGMDGFSPLGWRNFSMKHSKQTTKPMLVKNFFSFHHTSDTKNLAKNLQLKIFETLLKTKFVSPKNDSLNCQNPQNCRNINEFEKNNNIFFSKNKISSKNEIDKNFEYRRILKKQKRIKKHPRPPVWFPSGSLSQQVLPVHYIYVFYKRSRLPRDRYIRRRLRSNFDKLQNRGGPTALFTKITDFTLRKRAKPRRKYHRKRFVLENNQFLLTRRKFRGFIDEKETNRPSSKLFQTTSRSTTKPEKRIVQAKQRKKMTDSKQSSENLRVRQLRRRVQRQVYRPVSRYYPRSGGFVWPGDYLRLELVKAPQLNIANPSSMTPEKFSPPSEFASSRKIRKKKRRTLQEWQIQPKKYLLEKHNFKVLQKRYTKSGNTQL